MREEGGVHARTPPHRSKRHTHAHAHVHGLLTTEGVCCRWCCRPLTPTFCRCLAVEPRRGPCAVSERPRWCGWSPRETTSSMSASMCVWMHHGARVGCAFGASMGCPARSAHTYSYMHVRTFTPVHASTLTRTRTRTRTHPLPSPARLWNPDRGGWCECVRRDDLWRPRTLEWRLWMLTNVFSSSSVCLSDPDSFVL